MYGRGADDLEDDIMDSPVKKQTKSRYCLHHAGSAGYLYCTRMRGH